MKTMPSARELLTRYVLGPADAWEVIGWALQQRAEGVELPAIVELAELDASDPNFSEERLLALLVACVPGADAWTPARLKLFDRGRALLAGTIRPLEFCTLLQKFEQSVLDGKGPYPEWLHELWNACDWCDETWDLRDVPHLRDAVERMLRERA